jgi:hypothetical protein
MDNFNKLELLERLYKLLEYCDKHNNELKLNIFFLNQLIIDAYNLIKALKKLEYKVIIMLTDNESYICDINIYNGVYKSTFDNSKAIEFIYNGMYYNKIIESLNNKAIEYKLFRIDEKGFFKECQNL